MRRWWVRVALLAWACSAGATGSGGVPAMAGAAGQSLDPPSGPPAPPLATQVLANVNGTPACVAFDEAADVWVDATASGSQAVDDLLAAGRAAVVGGWVGTAEAPYGFLPQSWLARFDFAADGMYTAAGRVGDVAVPPLYYGDAERCPPAAWSFSGANRTGSGLVGNIAVLFWYDTFCGPPAWNQGVWSNVRWDVSGLRMRFSFSTGDGYGPIDFDLRRACPKS